MADGLVIKSKATNSRPMPDNPMANAKAKTFAIKPRPRINTCLM